MIRQKSCILPVPISGIHFLLSFRISGWPVMRQISILCTLCSYHHIPSQIPSHPVDQLLLLLSLICPRVGKWLGRQERISSDWKINFFAECRQTIFNLKGSDFQGGQTNIQAQRERERETHFKRKKGRHKQIQKYILLAPTWGIYFFKNCFT